MARATVETFTRTLFSWKLDGVAALVIGGIGSREPAALVCPGLSRTTLRRQCTRVARGGTRSPAARAGRRPGWTTTSVSLTQGLSCPTASVSLTEGVHCAADRRNLHWHSLQLEARWSGSAGHRRYRIPGTSRSRLPGAVADNLAATVYARSARGGTRSPAA